MSRISLRELQDVARALLETANESKSLPVIIHQIVALSDAVKHDAELASAFHLAHLPASRRSERIATLLKDIVHPLIVNAVLVLVGQGMEKKIVAFLEAVLNLAGRHEDAHVAQVQTAKPLTAAERAELVKKLEKKFGGTYHLQETVTPQLMAGLTVQVGDWRFDASVGGALKRMNHALYV